jgi:hypothetical protein
VWACGGEKRLAGGETARIEITANPPQLRLEIGRVLIPQVAFLLERRRDDRLEARRNERVQVRDGTGRTIEDRVVDDRRRAATECLRARDHLIEHGAEREQIGSRIDRLSARLLGRHVRHRSERRARLRNLVVLRVIDRRCRVRSARER